MVEEAAASVEAVVVDRVMEGVAAAAAALIAVIGAAEATTAADQVLAPAVLVIGSVRPAATTTLPTDKNVTDVALRSLPVLVVLGVAAVDLTTMADDIMMMAIEAADHLVRVVAVAGQTPETMMAIEIGQVIGTETGEATGTEIETGTETIGTEIRAAEVMAEAAGLREVVTPGTGTIGGPDPISRPFYEEQTLNFGKLHSQTEEIHLSSIQLLVVVSRNTSKIVIGVHSCFDSTSGQARLGAHTIARAREALFVDH